MIKGLEKRITWILENKPKTQDNDDLLCAFIWMKDVGGKEKGTYITATAFLIRFSMGDFVNPASIIRCRRKIQEKREDLRGTPEVWENRSKHSMKV